MKDDILKSDIWFTERNIHGAIVVYGAIGIRQYYGYKKQEAMQKYMAEVREKRI